jgi:branched-chain amino acid transport system substrate-binding protein
MKRLSVFMALLLATVLATIPFLASCGGGTTSPTTATGAPIKIGMMTPSTGPVPEKGIPGQHGIQDAMAYINGELGGAGGHPIQVEWRDSAYDMAKVGTIVQEYMDKGCVLFTTHSSSEMKAAQGKANAAGFPGIAVFGSTMNVHPAAHIYTPTPDYGDDWVAFAQYYLKNIWKGTGKPKMALHLLTGTVGQGTLDGAQAMAEQLGIELVDTENHTIGTSSEIESLTRVKSKNPDVLFISSVPAPTAVIIKNARQLGMTIPIGCASASFTSAMVSLAGSEAAEGVYGVYHTASWDDTNVPGIAKAADYCKKNHPADYGNMDYLGTWACCLMIQQILDNAVKNAGYEAIAKGDANAWKAVETQGIQKLSGYKIEGLQGGTVTYTPGDNRLDTYLKIYQVKSSKLVSITDWTNAPLVSYPQYK